MMTVKDYVSQMKPHQHTLTIIGSRATWTFTEEDYIETYMAEWEVVEVINETTIRINEGEQPW